MSGELILALDPADLKRFRLLAAATPKLAAQTLTFTAEKAKAPWIAGHRVFHRRNAWIDKGIRLRAATPSNLNAQVGSLDKYMARHVKGLGEEKRGGTGRLLIPEYDRLSAVKTHTQFRRALKGAERTKRKPFIFESASGKTFLARRKGKGRLPLEVLAVLRESADVPERLDALGIVAGVVSREFGPIYERLLLKWASEAH